MKSPFAIVLVAGLALAGLAVYLVNGQLARQDAALAEAQAIRSQVVPLTQVYAATQPLRYGETLSLEKLGVISWPSNALPQGVFVRGEDDTLFPDGDDRPRLVLRAIDAGEVLLSTKVTEPGGEAGITSLLAPGKRAFSINVDAQSGVSGFLRPGDNVDVFWTGNLQGVETTRLVGASLPIIAVDQSADMDDLTARVARTVSVMVEPSKVAALTQAQSSGRLTLSLVGVNDQGRADFVEVDQNALFGIEAPAEPVRQIVTAEPERCTIRTRKGAEMVEVAIPCTN